MCIQGTHLCTQENDRSGGGGGGARLRHIQIYLCMFVCTHADGQARERKRHVHVAGGLVVVGKGRERGHEREHVGRVQLAVRRLLGWLWTFGGGSSLRRGVAMEVIGYVSFFFKVSPDSSVSQSVSHSRTHVCRVDPTTSSPPTHPDTPPMATSALTTHLRAHVLRQQGHLHEDLLHRPHILHAPRRQLQDRPD